LLSSAGDFFASAAQARQAASPASRRAGCAPGV